MFVVSHLHVRHLDGCSDETLARRAQVLFLSRVSRVSGKIANSLTRATFHRLTNSTIEPTGDETNSIDHMATLVRGVNTYWQWK